MIVDTVSSHCVLYIDILGYEEYLRYNKDSSLLGDIKGFIKTIKDNLKLQDKLIFKSFSDNFIFAMKNEENEENDESHNFSSLKIISSYVFNLMLSKCKLLIRGGITSGDLYIDESIVYGAALIDAVGMEKKAVYPSIAYKEKANTKYVDTFGIKTEVQYLDLGCCKDNCLSNVNEYICLNNVKYDTIRTNLIELTNDTDFVKNPKLLCKYLWILTKFNESAIENKTNIIDIKIESTLNNDQYGMKINCK